MLPIPESRPPALTPEELALLADEARDPSDYVQGALAVDFARQPGEEEPTPVRRPAPDLPSPREWSAHLAQALVEVMAGARPCVQVLRWTSPEVYAVVSRRGAVAARRGAARRGPARTYRARVRSVHVCEPADGVAEVAAVVLDGTRVRALAMRLEADRDRGRWQVTALQVG
ncbi:MAG: Rv3235 family protein [Micrococcales bacterium]|nr:Rv3235 family protein [Micrococcales bacterium]